MPGSQEDYKKAAKEAEDAVSCVTDPELRKAAYGVVFANKLAFPRLKSYRTHRENWGVVLISLAFAAVGAGSLWCDWKPWTSIFAIAGTDVFILCLLAIVALHADGRAELIKIIPHRLPAFIMCGLLFVGLLHAFGNLYRHSDIICPQGTECSPNEVGSHICHADDALYFSTVTMTTLGYGDFAPADQTSRNIVIWQLVNSVLLVVLLLPVTMSRFAVF